MNQNNSGKIEVVPPTPETSGTKENIQSTAQIKEITEQEITNKLINERLSQIDKTQGVVILVLAVGFIALLVTVIGIVVQVWGFNSGVQKEMVKAMDTQTSIVKESNQKTNELIDLLKITFPSLPTPPSKK